MSPLLRRFGSIVVLAWASTACELGTSEGKQLPDCVRSGPDDYCGEPWPPLFGGHMIGLSFATEGLSPEYADTYFDVRAFSETGAPMYVAAVPVTTDSIGVFLLSLPITLTYVGLVDSLGKAVPGYQCRTPSPSRVVTETKPATLWQHFPMSCGPVPSA